MKPRTAGFFFLWSVEMKSAASTPKPKVVHKSVPNRFERPDESRAQPARSAGGEVGMPAKSSNRGGAGLK
ncbi:hypothetical protein [Burkholderia ubonensis]|uniref:hypothetical protein n=1 Tax=Burkholderia ubonensis TaxID=101571 RepID=UPI0012FC5B62|nr:hypothetical protein [Burkholderia ubonensis]